MCTTDGEILRSEVERSLSLCHTHHANSKIRYTQWTLRIASVSVGFCVVVKPSHLHLKSMKIIEDAY